jgi:hypothetical protein
MTYAASVGHTQVFGRPWSNPTAAAMHSPYIRSAITSALPVLTDLQMCPPLPCPSLLFFPYLCFQLQAVCETLSIALLARKRSIIRSLGPGCVGRAVCWARTPSSLHFRTWPPPAHWSCRMTRPAESYTADLQLESCSAIALGWLVREPGSWLGKSSRPWLQGGVRFRE